METNSRLAKDLSEGSQSFGEDGLVEKPNPESIDAATVNAEATSQDTLATSTRVKWIARFQLFSLYFCMFVAGWDGGTTGPLLQRMQSNYHVNFTVVSLIFIANCLGFLAGATMNVFLTDKFGFGKVLVMGSVAQVIGYAMMAPAPPFPVFCVAFFINGWGISLQDAQSNSYVASLKENSSLKMGILHAFYGFGAMCSPLAATQFAQMHRWSFHFLVSVSVATVNTLIMLLVFRGKTHDQSLAMIGQPAIETGTSEKSKYRQILSQKTLHLLAFFSLIYVGVEVTIGGWTVTYIDKHRGGHGSSGYISTGYFGGLTVGRIALLWLNVKIGERLAVLVYTLLTIGLELIVWLVPSLVGDAIAVSFVGFFFGPMYPILMNESGRVLHPWLLTGSIGWIASFGFTGSALFPFITGALASRFGIVSLQPLLIVLLVLMFITWTLVVRAPHQNTVV